MTGLIIVFCAIQQTQTNKHPAHRTIQTSMTIKYLIPREHTNYEMCSSILTAAACAVVSLGNSKLLFLFHWKACFSFQFTCRPTTIFLLFCGCNPSFQSNLSSADALVWLRWRFIAHSLTYWEKCSDLAWERQGKGDTDSASILKFVSAYHNYLHMYTCNLLHMHIYITRIDINRNPNSCS